MTVFVRRYVVCIAQFNRTEEQEALPIPPGPVYVFHIACSEKPPRTITHTHVHRRRRRPALQTLFLFVKVTFYIMVIQVLSFDIFGVRRK